MLDEQNKLLFRSYERHYSKTRERACETLTVHLGPAQRPAGQAGHHRLRRPGSGQGCRHRLRPGGVRHRRRGRTPTFRTPMPSSSWAARTPRSSFSAARWRSG
ncbi:MAG: hypothetical protein ACLRWQ_19595 [Flavonifractor plautii]